MISGWLHLDIYIVFERMIRDLIWSFVEVWHDSHRCLKLPCLIVGERASQCGKILQCKGPTNNIDISFFFGILNPCNSKKVKCWVSKSFSTWKLRKPHGFLESGVSPTISNRSFRPRNLSWGYGLDLRFFRCQIDPKTPWIQNRSSQKWDSVQLIYIYLIYLLICCPQWLSLKT